MDGDELDEIGKRLFYTEDYFEVQDAKIGPFKSPKNEILRQESLPPQVTLLDGNTFIGKLISSTLKSSWPISAKTMKNNCKNPSLPKICFFFFLKDGRSCVGLLVSTQNPL